MALPGVSFVVPIYNKADRLDGVLRQISRQAGDFARQYVFIDDGSTDDSLEMIKRATAAERNVIIETQENRGSANATNRAIALCDQPYIKFVDADDLIADAATSTLLRALDGSAACLAFGAAVYYEDESAIDLTASVDSPRVEILDRPLRLAMKNSLFNPTQCLARTAAVREVGGCDERVVHSQEYSLTLRLASRWSLLRVSAPVAFIPQDVNQRLSDDQGKQLQRVTRAVGLFMRDHPDLAVKLRRFACRRAASRSWRFARRWRGASILSPWFWRYLRSLFGIPADHAAFVENAAALSARQSFLGIDVRNVRLRPLRPGFTASLSRSGQNGRKAALFRLEWRHVRLCFRAEGVGRRPGLESGDRSGRGCGVDAVLLHPGVPRGCFNSDQILACDQAGITVTIPQPMTSGIKATGKFG